MVYLWGFCDWLGSLALEGIMSFWGSRVWCSGVISMFVLVSEVFVVWDRGGLGACRVLVCGLGC